MFAAPVSLSVPHQNHKSKTRAALIYAIPLAQECIISIIIDGVMEVENLTSNVVPSGRESQDIEHDTTQQKLFKQVIQSLLPLSAGGK